MVPTKNTQVTKPVERCREPVKGGETARANATKVHNTYGGAQRDLYGLSKQYGVTVDDILKANPELTNGLKNGMTIKIPQATEMVPTVENEPVKEDPKRRTRYGNARTRKNRGDGARARIQTQIEKRLPR